METITLEINEKSTLGKAIKTMLLALVNTTDVKIIDQDKYDEAFVEKVLNAKKNDKRTRIKSSELWQSI